MTASQDPETAKACFEDLGYGALYETIPKVVKEVDPFYCTILKTDVYIPCHLKICPFWVDRNKSQNCLLHYYKNRDVPDSNSSRQTKECTEELSVREIAEVLDFTVAETNSLLESGLTALRHMAIGLPIGYMDLQEYFEFLPTDAICCVCERPTPDNLTDTLRIKDLGLAYCSLNCRVRKNPTIIKLENRFHADIADILTWTLANFVKVSAMEEALKMDSYAIQQLIRQFLGSEVLKAFPGEVHQEAIEPLSVLFSFNTFS